LCFLDEGVDHHDALAKQEAVEGTTNAGAPTWPQLE
jgi:hypothetical protein